MEDLRVTLVQTVLEWEAPKANRAHFSNKLKEVNSSKTDLVLLPEMFSTGFSMNSQALAEKEEGPTLQWLQKNATEKDIAISASIIIKEGDNYFNRLYFIFPDGDFKTYDKRHLFTFADEDRSYQPGQKRLTLEYKGWKICPLICYDLRFPVWARNNENYDFLFYIANWPKTRITHWDTLLPARAIENLSYVAGLNRIGTDPKAGDYNGHSSVYNPLGNNLLSEYWEDDGIKTFTLKKKQLHRVREKFRFLPDQDKFKIE